MSSKKPNSSSDLSPVPIWRIKYRPTCLEDIKSSYPMVYKQFLGYRNQKNIPHLMLIGPRGCGKTVLTEILARELLNEEFKINYQLLFADDPISKEERTENRKQGYISKKKIGSSAGIQKRFRPFIQLRVKPFVSMRKFGDSPFKILAIKNFHALDVEQQAFRRIIEQYSDNCRMILITDKVSGIIDPIVSRCQVIMIPFLAHHHFTRFIKKVCDNEGIPIKLDVINFLRTLSDNNVGKALDLLQITFHQYNFVTLEHLSKMAHHLKDEYVKQLFVLTTQGNFRAIRKTLREVFSKQKKSKTQILEELSQIITQMPLERAIRATYLDMVAKCDYNSLDSRDDEIQLESLFAKMMTLAGLI